MGYISQTQGDDSGSEYDDDVNEGESDVELAEDLTANPKAKRKTSAYRKLGWEQFCVGVTKENLDDKLWRLSEHEWGGTKANSIFLIQGKEVETKKTVKKWYKCAFHNQSNCRRYYQSVLNKETGLYTILIAGGTEHSNHSVKLTKGAHKTALVAGVSSPSDLRKGPKRALGSFFLTRKLKESGQLRVKFSQKEQ